MNPGPAPLWLLLPSSIARSLHRCVLDRVSGLRRKRTRVIKKALEVQEYPGNRLAVWKGAWAVEKRCEAKAPRWTGGRGAGREHQLYPWRTSLPLCLAARVIYSGLKWALVQKVQCCSTPGLSQPPVPLCFWGLCWTVLWGGKGETL